MVELHQLSNQPSHTYHPKTFVSGIGNIKMYIGNKILTTKYVLKGKNLNCRFRRPLHQNVATDCRKMLNAYWR